MKKRFSVVVAIVLVLSIVLPVLASCVKEKTVKSIEITDAKTTYTVGDVIDYDSLKVKVIYDDDTTETKTVKQLDAAVTKADLSKAGNTSYTVSYKGKNVTVNLTVNAKSVDPNPNPNPNPNPTPDPDPEIKDSISAFVEPEYYTNYKTKSKERADGATESRADFRLTGETYEVGNVNKFIFRPTGTVLNIEAGEPQDIDNVKTTAKVYTKDTKAGTYALVADDSLDDIVAIDDNTYKFTEAAAGKYVKLEISVDEDEYDVDDLDVKTITVEFVVVDGGYNVYDQQGLSVMADMQKCAWADLWGVTTTWDATNSKYVMTPTANPVKLEADDQPLYTYVGNISSVILHIDSTNGLVLDADQMPAMYFWNGTEDEYNTALSSISGLSVLTSKLKGSLRDGENNDGDYRFNDLKPVTSVSADTDLPLNMQKGLFGTNKVSVSGNYNSIVVPNTASASGRMFVEVVDYGRDDAADDKLTASRANPVPHVSIFQIHMANTEQGRQTEYYIKNLALKGNAPKEDLSNEQLAGGVPAGIMMVSSYALNFTLNNLVADQFFTNLLVDGYDDNTGVDMVNTKLYDAYSNMFYLWRSKTNVENCEFIGAGGPLFILCDGDTHFMGENLTDANGCAMTVDTKSVLQSYATGGESWYSINNATALIGMLKGQLQTGVIKNLGKTVITKSDSGNEYINVIAAIICSPGDLLKGNSNSMMDVCGSYTTMDGEKVVEQFAMHNNPLVMSRENSRQFDTQHTGDDRVYNATYFPVIFQLGNMFAHTDLQRLYAWDATGPHVFGTQQSDLNWFTDTHDHMAIYMSAASQSGSTMAPYFGVVLEVNNLPQATA